MIKLGNISAPEMSAWGSNASGGWRTSTPSTKKSEKTTAGDYYRAENEYKQNSLRQDEELSALYDDTKSLDEDIAKVGEVIYAAQNGELGTSRQLVEDQQYIADKYGVSERAFQNSAFGAGGMPVDSGYQNLQELQAELEQRKQTNVDTLEQSDYRYDRMVGYEQRQADAAQYEEKVKNWEQTVREMPVGASAATLLSAAARGLELPVAWLKNLGHNDPADPENYVPLNYYDWDMTNATQTIRGTVADEIQGDGGLLRSAGAYLYETGMSTADNLLRNAIFGAGSKVVAGLGAASDAASGVLQRGGDNAQALWSAGVSGGLEAATEGLSRKYLSGLGDRAAAQGSANALLGQSAVGAAEETAASVGNIVADRLIMGDKSKWSQQKAAYQVQGDTEAQAGWKTLWDSAKQVGADALGGFLTDATLGGLRLGNTYLDGEITVMQQELAQMQNQKRLDELAAVYEKNVPPTRTDTPSALRESAESGIINKILVNEFDVNGAPVYALTKKDVQIQPENFLEQRQRSREAARKYGLTEQEDFSLDLYTKTTFYTLNHRMREGTLSDGDIAVASRIKTALNKFPQYKGRTYRNVGWDTEMDYVAFLSEYVIGEEVTLKSFTSTSKRPNGYPVFKPYVAHVVIDGKTGADIAGSYGYVRQQEVVLLPETLMYVSSITTANDGNPLIYLQEVVKK